MNKEGTWLVYSTTGPPTTSVSLCDLAVRTPKWLTEVLHQHTFFHWEPPANQTLPCSSRCDWLPLMETDGRLDSRTVAHWTVAHKSTDATARSPSTVHSEQGRTIFRFGLFKIELLRVCQILQDSTSFQPMSHVPTHFLSRVSFQGKIPPAFHWATAQHFWSQLIN